MSGEEIWQYFCHEEVEEIGNGKERTGEKMQNHIS